MSATSQGLAALTAAARDFPTRGLPPVHLWNPARCGDIDIVIRADGVWVHEGSPIGRPELVRLFSTVLRKDPDGYHLVTPVEKLRIAVEDLPFRAIAVERRGDDLVFTTDVGDQAVAGQDCRIEVAVGPEGQPAPAVRVRAQLWARLTRPVFYELVDMAEPRGGDLIVRSGGAEFVLGPAQ